MVLAESLPRVAGIDFPLRVNDVKKSIAMVGGPKVIARTIATPGEPLHLSLRPDDPFDHRIASGTADIQNIVMEIELPRDVLDSCSGDIRSALAKAGERAKVRPAFLTSPNYRFRNMSDFQYYTGDSQFTSEMKASVFRGDFEAINHISLEEGTQQTLLPPPRFSLQAQPFFYGYKQNPSVTIVDDGSGTPKLVSKAPRIRLISSILIWGDAIPQGPPSELETTPRLQVNKCIKLIEKLFETRPSYTRRALEALLPIDMRRYLRYALPYVAYFYKSGPWRGAYIAYGRDPTTDSSMAQYQVEHFRVGDHDAGSLAGDDAGDASSSSVPGGSGAFTFNGLVMPASPMLQLCDITEQFLAAYIAGCPMREEVDPSDGWYPTENIAIIRKVLKAELSLVRDKRDQVTESFVKQIIEASR